MKRKLVSLGCMGILVVVLSGCFEPPTTYNLLYVYPENSYQQNNTYFDIMIKMDLIQEINGFETDIEFDTSHINVVSYTWGDFFPEGSFKSNPNIDNSIGKISNLYALVIGQAGIKSAKTIITFRCIGFNLGLSQMKLVNSSLVNSTSVISHITGVGNITVV